MEYLDFGGSYSQADLGQRLAEMHKAEPAVSMLTRHCTLSACMACTCSPTCLSSAQIQQVPFYTPVISPGTTYSFTRRTSLFFQVYLPSLLITLALPPRCSIIALAHAQQPANPVRTCAKQSHATVRVSFWSRSVQDETAKKGMFGFPIDNTIGGTSQPNGWMDNWIDFYRERRLQHQLKLTKDPKLQQMGKRLCDNLEHFFQGVDVGFLRPLQQPTVQFAAVFACSTTCICCKTVCTSTSSLACQPAMHPACQGRCPCGACFR